jgi:hypothetical protein
LRPVTRELFKNNPGDIPVASGAGVIVPFNVYALIPATVSFLFGENVNTNLSKVGLDVVVGLAVESLLAETIVPALGFELSLVDELFCERLVTEDNVLEFRLRLDKDVLLKVEELLVCVELSGERDRLLVLLLLPKDDEGG